MQLLGEVADELAEVHSFRRGEIKDYLGAVVDILRVYDLHGKIQRVGGILAELHLRHGVQVILPDHGHILFRADPHDSLVLQELDVLHFLQGHDAPAVYSPLRADYDPVSRLGVGNVDVVIVRVAVLPEPYGRDQLLGNRSGVYFVFLVFHFIVLWPLWRCVKTPWSRPALCALTEAPAKLCRTAWSGRPRVRGPG